jgi:hypothetical protein
MLRRNCIRPFKEDRVGWRAAQLAQAHAAAELALLAAVLADHSVGVALASREGVRRWHFTHEDLRLIWIASGLCRWHDLVTLLRLVRAGLAGENLWDSTQTRANAGASMLWSDASLVAFAQSELASSQLVTRRARRLLELDARLDRATLHHRAMVSALDLDIPLSAQDDTYPAALPLRGAA